jgi:hypothetical protein
LTALRRAARTLAADAQEVAALLGDVCERLDSGQAQMEAAGSLHSAMLLAGVHWSLVYAARSLPWLRSETLLLAAALPQVLGRLGDTAELPHNHPWQNYKHTSPLRLDEDLFEAQFEL